MTSVPATTTPMDRSEPSPAVLTVAGSDPSGGAGLQADLRTFAALGAYGMSVLTLATDYTTEGVDDLHLVPSGFVVRQLERVVQDVPPAATKTGMLFDAAMIEAVTEAIRRLDAGPLVVDPVVTTRRGEALLSPDAVAAMRQLIGHATVITPSRPEAAELAEMDVHTRGDAERAARAIHEDLGPTHVVVTGGHAGGDVAADCWFDGSEITWLEAERQPYPVHGAGDTFSAAITVRLAEGDPVDAALRLAKRLFTEAIRHAPERGHGHRPLSHEAGGEAEEAAP